jgi:hypothetical protein
VIHELAFLIALGVFWLIPAAGVARLAARRGRDFQVFLLMALVIPWPLMLLVVLGLPRRESSSNVSRS